jgi:hypothetical protein
MNFYHKPKILLQLGPIHLFFTTEVFCIWELKEKYDLIILASEDHQTDVNFKKIIKIKSIIHVEYIKKNKFIKMHISINDAFDKVLKLFNLSAVLIYNSVNLDNQYLLYKLLVLKKKIPILQYQNAAQIIDPKKERSFFIRYFDFKIDNLGILKKIKLISLTLKTLLSQIVHYKIIPVIKFKHFLFLPLSLNTKINNQKIIDYFYKKLIKIYFVYTLQEKNYTVNKLNIKCAKLVNHPVKKSYKQVFKYLGHKTTQKKQILILPSKDYAAILRLKTNFSKKKIRLYLLSYWFKLLDHLSSKYANYKIKLKIHPNVSGIDLVWWNIILSAIKKKYRVEILKKNTHPQLEIIRSKILISEVSSVLWWASFLRNKTIISLNYFKYHKDSAMNLYNLKIFHIKNFKSIHRIKLNNKSKNIKLLKNNICDYINKEINKAK